MECNHRIVEHWLYDAFKTGRAAKGGDLAAHVSRSEMILRLYPLPRPSELVSPKKNDIVQVPRVRDLPSTCDAILVDIIPSALDRNNFSAGPNGCRDWATGPCGTVHLPQVALPAPRYPRFKLVPLLEDVIKDEGSGDYWAR